MLYITGKNIFEMVNIINNELKNVQKWLNNNYLSINTEKSKFIIIGNQKMIFNVNSNEINVKINNVHLQRVENIKYLGIIIDQNLNFKQHVKYIQNKMSKKVYFLNRVSKHLSSYAKLIVYKTIIMPQIDYCASILLNIPKYMLQQVQIIQNRAMRKILNCNKYTPVKLMLNVIDDINVQQRIIYKSLEFIFKIRIKALPEYLYENLNFVRDSHKHDTRNKDNYVVSRFNTTVRKNSLFIKGIELFNKLPKNIKECTNLKEFKHLLKIHLKYENVV